MAASKAFALPILILIYVSRVAAIQKSTSSGKVVGRSDTLCISIAAYENPTWIQFLIANVLRFSDCSTKVVLHLNSETNYSKEAMDTFSRASNRVFVNPDRIAVGFNKLSILHAHVLNAHYMHWKWGANGCGYYAIQASNQLWIKPGAEAYVAEFGLSGMKQRAYLGCDGFCEQQHWNVQDRAWSMPEGVFAPWWLMYNFQRDYLSWYQAECSSGTEDCFMTYSGKEEDWLQTYACIHMDEARNRDLIESKVEMPTTCALVGPTLCRRFGGTRVLTVPEVEEIITQGSDCSVDVFGRPTPYYEKHQEFCNRTSADSMPPFSLKVNHAHKDDRADESDTHDPNGPLAKWLDLVGEPLMDPVIAYIMNLTYRASAELLERSSC